MTRFGGSTATRLTRTSTPASVYPKAALDYASTDGAITVPVGALDRWFTYRATGAAVRRDVPIFGDSTTFGSGGNYSWVQRLRDRAVSAGLADGGKGIFAGNEALIGYDAPEVNGLVSITFSGTTDTYDTLTGNYLYDDGTTTSGHVLNGQFRATGLRIWYIKRNTAGSFTYSIDGGTAVTVNAQQAGNPDPHFVSITGLSAGTTHTVTITNGTGMCWIALAPINATGVAFQKQAVSGSTFNNFFFGANGTPPYTQDQQGFRYQIPMGLAAATVGAGTAYQGATVDTSITAADRVNPPLAMTHLGFNDLSNSTSADLPAWTEYVKKFGGACRDAGCDGIVISGQLPYNSNWPTYGAARFAALKATAAAQGLTFVDLFYPIGGPSLSYAGGTSNPHLTKPQYQAQADYLWDNLLGL